MTFLRSLVVLHRIGPQEAQLSQRGGATMSADEILNSGYEINQGNWKCFKRLRTVSYFVLFCLYYNSYLSILFLK